MKKIIIVMPCWKRAQVVELVAKQLDIFFRDTIEFIDLTVLYVFSFEDPEIDQLYSVYLGANHHRDCVFSENKLLGRKLNDGISYAAKYNYDYIMNFGSDDLIHADILKLYQNALKMNYPVIGLNRVFFTDNESEPFMFSYYNQPNLVGAGRLIHRRVIEDAINQFGGLYKADINRGMDTFSANRIRTLGYLQTMIDPGEFPYIVDIKTDVNINSVNDIIENNKTGNIKLFPKDYIKQHYSELYAG